MNVRFYSWRMRYDWKIQKKMLRNFNGEKACTTATWCIGEEIKVRLDVFAGKNDCQRGLFVLNVACCLPVRSPPLLRHMCTVLTIRDDI